MASTFSQNKNIEEPSSGSYVDAWATPVNADWSVIDRAFGGVQALNVVSLSGVQVLTATQYQPPIINISGTLTANVTYQLPSGVGGFWFISNATTGAFTVTWASAGGGTSVTLAQGARTAVISDGTNVSQAFTVSPNAAGSNTQIQYNNAGALGASANFTWSGTALGVVGNASIKGTLQLQGSSSGGVSLTAPASGGTASWTLPAADGTSGQILTTNGSGSLYWSTGGGGSSGVSSFNAGTTGFTPVVATTGAITLAGTLGVANGGTGATTFSAGVLIGNGTTPVTGVTTIPYSMTINGTSGISLTVNATSGTHSTQIADSAGNRYNAGYLEVPISSGAQLTGSYTAVLSDSGKTLLMNGTSLTATIPAHNVVVYPVGTTLTFINLNSSPLSIAINGGDSLVNSSTGTGGTKTLAQYGMATAIKVITTGWIISGTGLT